MLVGLSQGLHLVWFLQGITQFAYHNVTTQILFNSKDANLISVQMPHCSQQSFNLHPSYLRDVN